MIAITNGTLQELSHYALVRDWQITLQDGTEIMLGADVYKQMEEHDTEEGEITLAYIGLVAIKVAGATRCLQAITRQRSDAIRRVRQGHIGPNGTVERPCFRIKRKDQWCTACRTLLPHFRAAEGAKAIHKKYSDELRVAYESYATRHTLRLPEVGERAG